MKDTLDELRTIIDQADQDLLEALARRMNAVQKVGTYKRERGIAPLDAARWQQVLTSRIQKGISFGLDEELVKDIYETIHTHALNLEGKLIMKNEQ